MLKDNLNKLINTAPQTPAGTARTAEIVKELAEAAGRRDKKFKVVEIPIPRAKKLLKLIRQYCYREEDLQKVYKWMAQNTKLALYWGMIR